MSAKQLIEELKRMPEDEQAQVVNWVMENDEAFFVWADSLPINRTMSEDEILALPRLRPRREGSA